MKGLCRGGDGNGARNGAVLAAIRVSNATSSEEDILQDRGKDEAKQGLNDEMGGLLGRILCTFN